MALTFSIAGLQTQLQLVATAIDSGDFATARSELAKADLILVGLPTEVKQDDRLVKMRDDLKSVREAIESASANTSDRRRLIRTGVSHGGRQTRPAPYGDSCA